MRAFLLGLLMGLFLSIPSWAAPLKVQIALKGASGSSVWTITTKIINVSDQIQKVPVWLCSYGWSWVASTPAIVTGLESCAKNFVQEVSLKPGDSYTRDLQVVVSSRAKIGSLTFELGFNPQADWFGIKRGVDPSIESLKGIEWSNAIVVSVTKEMLSAAIDISDDIENASIKDFHSHWGRPEYKEPMPPVSWRQCSIDSDCDSVAVSCGPWVIANRAHLRDVQANGAIACLQSIPPGPKPVVACVHQRCIDKWRVCAQDSDCVVSDLICWGLGWKPVNGSYLKDLQARQHSYVQSEYKQQCPDNNYQGLKPAGACINQVCQVWW